MPRFRSSCITGIYPPCWLLLCRAVVCCLCHVLAALLLGLEPCPPAPCLAAAAGWGCTAGSSCLGAGAGAGAGLWLRVTKLLKGFVNLVVYELPAGWRSSSSVKSRPHGRPLPVERATWNCQILTCGLVPADPGRPPMHRHERTGDCGQTGGAHSLHAASPPGAGHVCRITAFATFNRGPRCASCQWQTGSRG